MYRLVVFILCVLILIDSGALSARIRRIVRSSRTTRTRRYTRGNSTSHSYTTTSPQLPLIFGATLGTIFLVTLVGSSWCGADRKQKQFPPGYCDSKDVCHSE